MIAKLLIALGLAIAMPVQAGAGGDVPVLRDGDGAAATMPTPAILMFWAEWCVPCRGEIARLGDLDRAAGTVPVLVAPIGDPVRSRRMLPKVTADRLRFAGTQSWAWMQKLSGGSTGLPVSVALDGKGQVCAVLKGPLRAATIRQWRTACGWAG